MLVIVGLVWHESWAHWVCWAGAIALLATWLWPAGGGVRQAGAREHQTDSDGSSPPAPKPVLPRELQTLILILGLALMLGINYFGYLDIEEGSAGDKVEYITVAWPWFTPIGSVVAFVWGYLLARVKNRDTDSS